MSKVVLDVRGLAGGWSAIIVLWATLSYLCGVPEYLVASPGSVSRYVLSNGGRMIEAVCLTGSQALVGWFLGLLVGGAIGTIAYYLPMGRRILLPPVLALQTTPIIALAPLVAFWLGYGWLAKVAVAALVAMLPIVLATYSGLDAARPAHLYTFRLAGAGEFEIFRRVRIRSASLALVPALKVAMVFAVVGSIVAEFMGGNSGLGFLIMKAVYGSKSAMLIAAVLGAAIIGQGLLYVLERVLDRWEGRFGAEA